jgi:hypothetical protein
VKDGITIPARPAEVWPWVAQIGEDRGSLYSYTSTRNDILVER